MLTICSEEMRAHRSARVAYGSQGGRRTRKGEAQGLDQDVQVHHRIVVHLQKVDSVLFFDRLDDPQSNQRGQALSVRWALDHVKHQL